MREPTTIVIGNYSRMTKGLFAICIPMFTGFAVYSYWSAAFALEHTSQAATHVLLGSFFVWLLIVSLKLAQFLRCRILIQAEGIRLSWPSEDRSYSWLGLGWYRDRQGLQIVEVYDRDGNRILIFDYHLIGFTDVYSSIAARLPARA